MERTKHQYAYLTILNGQRAGSNVVLDEQRLVRVGRGYECAIVLGDPLCSRIHAVFYREGEHWMVRDADSRNGTFVNGQKTDVAALGDRHKIQVGSTEFMFQLADQPPTAGTSSTNTQLTQTIIRESQIEDVSIRLPDLANPDQAEELLLLYQLSMRLLGCQETQEVLRIALDLLKERTRASVVGFLWTGDDGLLKPWLVMPEKFADQIILSESLTHAVCQEGHALWIANQQVAIMNQELQHYADAICVPLVSKKKTLGAIHVYLESGRFRQSHFEFAISVANIVSVALVRARKEQSLATAFQSLKAKSPGYDEMIGQSKPMLDLKSRIERLGAATGCVLVRGESGAGKELVARAVHRHSARADRPMLSINCAAIPLELMESQLFGHKAGAFTGADRDHLGLFQQADTGTLFLDEVGELNLQGQSKLLRILEGHPFLPVGATQEVRVDVRVIAATNRDLLAYVKERKFREDLYYRLSVFELHLPPLRERGDDIGLLMDFFLEHFGRLHGRPGVTFSPAARDRLLNYQWPGNVRQLRNVIDSAVVLAINDQIDASDLGLRDVGDLELDSLRIDHWEKKLIMEALRRARGNVPDASKLLGIGRATLYRKLDDYNIPR